jgi:hypothetical protein
MATKKGTHRTGKTTRRSSSLTRRAILSGLGAGLVVPALQADVTPSVQSATKSPTLAPQASYDLKEISELTIKIDYDAKAKVITISACK